MSQQKKINQLKNQIDHLTSKCELMKKTCNAHDKAKFMLNSARGENEQLKARVAELEECNANLQSLQGMIELSDNQVKAEAIRDAMTSIIDKWEVTKNHASVLGDNGYIYISNRALDEYADKLKRGEL